MISISSSLDFNLEKRFVNDADITAHFENNKLLSKWQHNGKVFKK